LGGIVPKGFAHRTPEPERALPRDSEQKVLKNGAVKARGRRPPALGENGGQAGRIWRAPPAIFG
jgi:hypothetical protein